MLKTVGDLFGTGVAFILYGFYVCLFVVTMWTVRVHGTDKLSSPIMSALIALFIINLFMTALSMLINYYEFIPSATLPSDHTMIILTMLADACITSSMLIADTTICWRLWVIWRRDWRVMVIPGLALIAQLGAGLATFILDIIKICRGYGVLREARYQTSAAALIYLSLGLNIIVTGLIVGRLWWADRQIKKTYTSADTVPVRQYTRVIIVLIETGALYNLFLVAYLISNYVGDGMAQYLFVSSLSVIVAIVPTLIQLQRALGYLQPSEMRSNASSTMLGNRRSTNIRFAAQSNQTETTTYQTQPVKRNSSHSKSLDESPTDDKADEFV